MAIGPIEMQGQILRTQDFAQIKHQEDVRGNVEQSQIQVTKDVEEERQANRVSGTQESANTKNQSDASDKGSNEYSGDGGAGRREAREARALKEAREARARDGKVLLKSVGH
ncbi:MAG: hypothetical protein IJ058_04960 [Lachnospiraceae bacterium]|nr:hypothetical protein [Lachnospiraceae bacterium]